MVAMLCLVTACYQVALDKPNMTPDFPQRRQDWRIGPIVYQVFVDRFAPPADLESKRRILTAPRRVMTWKDVPTGGTKLADLGVWSHELDFWGGDLSSLKGKLPYIQGLGADVIYLQPIHQAFTNHKYDAQDYRKLSPEIGTRAELKEFISTVHDKGMKLMLDGVFNHMGKTSPRFQEASSNPKSPFRDWYRFGESYPYGYQAWFNVANLPCLNLENPSVRQDLWNAKDSVVLDYLKDGVDGWRLDVAYELGPEYLLELSSSVRRHHPQAVVIGEISGYPSSWFPSVDGVYNFHALNIIKQAVAGTVSGGRAGRMLRTMVEDAGIENILRSWLLLDNHDTDRLSTEIPDRAHRHFLQSLQFTLPGAPVIYYGTELGMIGKGDPANRAPMRWDWVQDSNPDLLHIRRLIALRKKHAALRFGDFLMVETEKLVGFVRSTDRFRETLLVLANPTAVEVTETLPTRIGRGLSWGIMEDVFEGGQVRAITGLMTVTMPPYSVRAFRPMTDPHLGHSPFERIP